VGSVLTNVIGDLGQQYGWQEGSSEKLILHGLAGLIEAKVANGNIGAGIAAGVINEALLPFMTDYLKEHGIPEFTADGKRNPEFDSLLKLGSGLIGAATGALAGGDTQSAALGLNTAVTATQNNRMMHPDEIAYLHDKDRVARFIDYYKEATGEVLTADEAIAYLDRYGAAMVDKSWAAVNGQNDIVATFIGQESINAPTYKDSQGFAHNMFQVTPFEYENATINLKPLFDAYGDSSDPNHNNVAQWMNNNSHPMSPTDFNRQFLAGGAAGTDAAGKDVTFFGELGNILQGTASVILLAPYTIAQSIGSDEAGPLDEVRMNAYYKDLLRLQGRPYDLGYLSGFDEATQSRMMWEGIAITAGTATVGTVARGITRGAEATGRSVVSGGTVELFTDARGPQIPGAAGVGPLDASAVTADARNMANIPSNSQVKVVANNPYILTENGGTKSMMDFLPEAARITEPGGSIVINGNSANPYTAIPSQAQLDALGLKIQYQGPLLPEYQGMNFLRTDGSKLDLPTQTIIFIKK
jgi:hypothetical protein